jgi:hypothetical protein
MALTNAAKQQRWRERNVVVLTGTAQDIAERLIDMADQNKLRRVAAYLTDHLRHPERTPLARAIALGRAGMDSLNGRLSKTAALAELTAPTPKPTGSWRVEAISKNGKRWVNGVRLGTKAEAEAYVVHHVPHDLKDAGATGYVTSKVLHGGEPPNCSISRRRKGGRTYLNFEDGQCALLGWHAAPAKQAARQR